jgi:hypothetical protein
MRFYFHLMMAHFMVISLYWRVSNLLTLLCCSKGDFGLYLMYCMWSRPSSGSALVHDGVIVDYCILL